MSGTTLDGFVSGLSQSLTEFVVAYLLAFIAGGIDPLRLAKIVLAIKLNVFALPLSRTPALQMPLWCWYVVVVLWLRQWLLLSGYSPAEVVTQVERHAGGER